MKSKRLAVEKAVSIYQKIGILVILVVEIIAFSLMTDKFLALNNIMLVGRQISFVGMSAVGMTMVLLLGEIDISVGSILAFSGCVTAKLIMESGWAFVPAAIVAVLLSMVFGVITGFFVTKLKITSLIATLAMQQIIKGCTYLLTGGIPVKINNDNFKFLGQGFIAGVVPVPIVFMLILFVIGFVVLHKTRFGRRIYAVGGNTEAARLSGIKTDGIKIIVFIISAAAAGIAGVIMASRLGTGQPSTGNDFGMDVLTATVLGGVMLIGGKGKILNVFIGTVIIGILTNGLVLMNVLEYWQWIVKGLVFVFALAMSNLELIVNKDK
ncbi:MAG: ABC transporter permease [Lachnospiraceae bacterium]|jgi:ribose transport system permease protein